MMHISFYTYIYIPLTCSDHETEAHSQCSSLLLQIQAVPRLCCNNRFKILFHPFLELISFHQHRQCNLRLEMTNYLERAVRGSGLDFSLIERNFSLVLPQSLAGWGPLPSLMKTLFPFPLDRVCMYILQGKCIMRHQLENIKRRGTPVMDVGMAVIAPARCKA